MSTLYDNLEQVQTAVADAGLHPSVDDVPGRRRDATALTPGEALVRVGSAWGDPALPAESPWPRFGGRLLAHVAQLDLRTVPPLESWPNRASWHLVIHGLDETSREVRPQQACSARRTVSHW